MPYRFQYPAGHPGPQLSPDGKTTVTDLDKVELFVWNCNEPEDANSKIIFKNQDGSLNTSFLPTRGWIVRMVSHLV